MLPRAAATVLLLLLVSAPAVAADRDRDLMPDRWERKHRLDRARGDADRDGLRNRDEHRARTHPRRRDSDRDDLRDGDEIRFGWHPRRPDTDRDGIRDGRENAGVVSAVDGLRVTIRRARGGRLTGLLEDPLALACVTTPPLEAPETGEPAADDAIEWDPDWGEPPLDLDEGEDVSPPAGAAQADEDATAEDLAADEAEEVVFDESGAPEGEECTVALRVGALVHEATSELGASGRRLTRLRLVAT